MLLGQRVTDETMRDVFPEQKLGTFGHTAGFGPVSGGSRIARGAGHAYQGVMPATIRYENLLRRAMVEGWAKEHPEVQAAMAVHGGDINIALRDVARTNPLVINDISRRVDDALGNYRSYNRVERNIKQIIPFYGWDRHVIRSMGRLARDRPQILAGLQKVGQVGDTQNENQFGGPLPSFLKGSIGLPGLPSWAGPLNGRIPMLETSSVNPFSTAADIAGLAGSRGSSEVAKSINPLVQGFLEQFTGTSLLTGAPLPKRAVGPDAAREDRERVHRSRDPRPASHAREGCARGAAEQTERAVPERLAGRAREPVRRQAEEDEPAARAPGSTTGPLKSRRAAETFWPGSTPALVSTGVASINSRFSRDVVCAPGAHPR